MPTPKGKPVAGDVIQHRDGGPRLHVVKRDPGTDFYSIVVRREDGGPRLTQHPRAFGFPDACWRILDFSWRLQRGEYKFVT